MKEQSDTLDQMTDKHRRFYDRQQSRQADKTSLELSSSNLTHCTNLFFNHIHIIYIIFAGYSFKYNVHTACPLIREVEGQHCIF